MKPTTMKPTTMKLIITTPLALILETDDVVHVRAEDETGAFGVLAGHADFLTVLTVSVITWRDGSGAEHYAAVRGGVLQVSGGRAITVGAPEAVVGDDLRRLQTEVLATFRRRLAEERAAHMDAQRLYFAAIRQIYRFVRSERTAAVPGGPGPVPIEAAGA
jgi:F-type H+-transporting ATPase subunit epsilon